MKSNLKVKNNYIRVNDIFDDLSEENKRLNNELMFANNCLKVLEKFKSLLNEFYIKYKQTIDSEDKQKFNQLEKVFNSIIKSNEQKFIASEDKELNKTDEELDSILRTKHTISDSNTGNEEINGSIKELSEDLSAQNRNTENLISDVRNDSNTRRSGRTDRKIYAIQRTPKPKTHNKPKTKPKDRVIPEPEEAPNSLLLLRRNNFDEKTQTYVCPNPSCDKFFEDQCKLHKHFYRTHHSIRKYFCDHQNCNKSFKTRNGLETHSLCHSNFRPYSCPVEGCEYRCKRPRELSQHSSVHSNIKAFKCEECGKTFKKSETLLRHQLLHKSEPSFKCYVEGCHQFFKSEYYLMKHRRLVHNIITRKDRTKKCDWPGCDYQTDRNDLFSFHKRGHTGEKPIVCEWPGCPKRFRWRDNLNTHLLVHKDLKPFDCHWPGCQYRCRTRGNLKLHLRVHQK